MQGGDRAADRMEGRQETKMTRERRTEELEGVKKQMFPCRSIRNLNSKCETEIKNMVSVEAKI